MIKINPGSTCPSNTSPVFQAASNSIDTNDRHYRYLTSSSALTLLISQGWISSGIAFCAPESARVVVTPTPAAPPANKTEFVSTTAYQNCMNNNPEIVGSISASESFRRMKTGTYASREPGLSAPPITGKFSTFSFKITVDANLTSSGKSAAGIVYGPAGTEGGRFVTISRNRCDFSKDAIWISAPPFLGQTPQPFSSGSLTVAINEANRKNPYSIGNYDNLTTGEWYVNVGTFCQESNPTAVCDLVFQWAF